MMLYSPTSPIWDKSGLGEAKTRNLILGGGAADV